jgi:L-lactate dehydrogenase complex protein LldF
VSTAGEQFLRKAAEKSVDLRHRNLIRHAIDQYSGAVVRGRARFLDWEEARQRSHEIKWEAVNHLDRYLLAFEQNVKARGGHVFWAETSEDARNYIADLARQRNVRSVVKSKSMVTEEIHLNAALEKVGVEVFETDLGEFIVQLRDEPPYHIVTPAMHLTRSDIAALFKEKLGNVDTDDPQQLVAAARIALRKAFFSAEMGITGANFLVADSGMIALTSNEGNARLCSSIPRIHVAIAGIEKVIPRVDDLAVLWPVLAAAGTGQPITCYSTLIGGPRGPNEIDGPEEFHVVLLDNGRSNLLADPEQREVLNCIRCGACLNVCPVYRTVGGHTYGTTYQGPIGSVLTPHLRGIKEFQHLSSASSLCGACTEACPVKIDLHHHLLQNRRNAVETKNRSWSERVGAKLWRWTMLSPQRFALLGAMARSGVRLINKLGLAGTALDPARSWTRDRAPLQVPGKSFRALWEKQRREQNGSD